jgi:hypothetical protein
MLDNATGMMKHCVYLLLLVTDYRSLFACKQMWAWKCQKSMNCFVKCVQILDIIMQLVEYFQDAHFNSTKFNAI